MRKILRRKKRFRIRWHQSIVVQAASLVSLILICAYAASIIIAAQGFDTIASIAYRVDVEQSFANHLNTIKEVHTLKQEAFATRIKAVIPPTMKTGTSTKVTEEQVLKWFAQTKAEQIFPLLGVKFEERDNEQYTEVIEWIGKQRLRIFNQLITFPRGQTYEDFATTEDIQQRYKVIGTQLESEIKPALIKANAVVLLFTFLFLITAFLIMARLFNQKVEKVINGISHWSEVDQSFRFGKEFKGELNLICRQFNRMADEVEENRQKRLYLEKVASWQTIARKLAHEVKNPLTPIQMMITQLAKGYNGDDEKYKQLLENSKNIITEEVDSLRRMVDHFSKFARLPEPKFQSTDMMDLVKKVVDLQSPAFPQHNIHIAETTDHAIARVDPDLIKQVLINLIKNAAEASSDNSCEIKLTITEEGKNLMISVIDNGPGIPAEMIDKVFEAYFTTKHTGPNPGMGLGLAVCQKILLDHSGEITLSSKPGKTVFTLVIPKEEENL